MNNVLSPLAPLRNEVFLANRAAGRIALAVAIGSGRSRPAQVYEAGSLRVRFPHHTGRALDAVLINTAGGTTGGDRFELDLKVGAKAEMRFTTAAAEKIYRSLGPDAETDVKLDVGPGGTLAWLPQETILFDRGRFRRKIAVDLAEDANLLLAESCVFGRSAMGETVVSGRFVDCWRLRVGGSLRFADTFRLDGDIWQSLAKQAVAAGGAAVGSVVKFPGSEDNVAALRDAQQEFAGEVGASAWNGLVVARCVAASGAALRHDLTKVLTALGGAPLPRLWVN